MPGRKQLSIFVFLIASVAAGNGGPIDMSHIAATGNLRMMNQPEVRLLSEDLRITVERDHVVVFASYRLRNEGETVEIVYGFPVDRFAPGEFESLEEDITEFRIECDGVSLAPGEPLAEDTLFLEIEGMIHSGTVIRTWIPAEIRLEAGSLATLEVSYMVRPCFMDWENTKEPFVSHSHRFFRYILDPSGSWGDGRAEVFSCFLDFSELIRNGGEVVSLPEAGRWVEPGLYQIRETGLDLASAPPVEFVYNPHVWLLSDEMRTRAVPVERLEEVVSSETLLPQAGNSYGARNLFDSDRRTAWSVSMNEPGAVPWIRVVLPEVELSCLAIIGGYAKSEEAWYDNARVREVRLTLFGGGGTIGEYDYGIEDTGFPGDLPLGRAFQIVVEWGEPLEVDSLMLEVTGIYPGRLCDDLCISEMLLME